MDGPVLGLPQPRAQALAVGIRSCGAQLLFKVVHPPEKGLRRWRALVTHGLRTALIPMATFFAYQFALLFVGATFTEKIFGWHGMGEFFVDSIVKNDVNSVAGVTLFVAILVLVAGFLSDLVYAALDPRVRV